MATMLPKMAHFGPRKVRHASFHQRKRSYHHWAIFDLLSLTPMTPWGTIPNTGCLLNYLTVFVCVCVFWQKLTKEFSEIDALFIQSNVMILSRIHDHEVFD